MEAAGINPARFKNRVLEGHSQCPFLELSVEELLEFVF